MPGPFAAAAITAGIQAAGQLFGAKKSSNAAKDSARIQTDFAEKALGEQRRVYDIEKAEETRQRSARAGILGGLLTPLGPGSLPNSYGTSDDQQAAKWQANQGGRGGQGGGGGAVPPSQSQTQDPMMTAGPSGGGRPTVTLQAPTGEIMDVDVDQVPALLQKGAIMFPNRGQQRNAFGGSYGLA